MSQDYVAGQHLGDYEILCVLGAGGMGKVYKVRNVISDRVEAMKILLPNLASEKELADRFLREIKLLATLHHPNIAALRTALTLDNQLVMIMEYVDGVTLSSKLQQGPIAAADAVSYVDQVLSALSYAHKLNIVHRDIKPANMMLTSDGIVKLMDFGIARSGGDRSLTTTGTTLGSLNYMPPEQVKGEAADARSDIYSLGVSMYEMVTGMLPFEAASNYSLMAAHVQQVPKAPIIHRPGLPESLNQIILMALAKDPAQRFQSADAFRAALKTVDVKELKVAPAGTTMPPTWTSPYSGHDADPTLAVNTPAPELARAGAARSSGTGGSVPAAAASAGMAAGAVASSSSSASSASVPAGTADQSPAGSSYSVAAAASKPGLYMGLGALVVVGVLFAAGFYLPRRSKIHAGENKAAFPSQQSTDGTTAVQPNAAPSSGTSTNSTTAPEIPSHEEGPAPKPEGSVAEKPSDQTPDNSVAARPGTRSTTNRKMSASSGKSGATREERSANTDSGQEAADNNAKAEAAASKAALEEAERQDDQLTSRASSVSQSLDSLKRQQSAQGFGLRGDVVSAERRMQSYLSKAQAALQRQDAANAQKYFDLADKEITFLEKFLGH